MILSFDASCTAKGGVTYTSTYAWILQLQDGKVTNASAFFDSITFNELWKRGPVSQSAEPSSARAAGERAHKRPNAPSNSEQRRPANLRLRYLAS